MENKTNDIYGELIGCDKMHYALVKQDNAEKYEAETPVFLAPAAEVAHETSQNTVKRHYDNKPRFVTIVEGDTNVKITVSGVPCSLASKLTGKPYDAEKGLFYDTGSAEKTPWAALLGRMELGDGGYRYFNYLKGKFAIGSQVAHTREDNITVHTVDLTYSAVVTEHEFQVDENTVSGVKGVFADTTDEKFTGAGTWFSAVQTPPEVQAAAAAAASADDGEPVDDGENTQE